MNRRRFLWTLTRYATAVGALSFAAQAEGDQQAPSAGVDDVVDAVNGLDIPDSEKTEIGEELKEAIEEEILTPDQALAAVALLKEALAAGQVKPEELSKLASALTTMLKAGISFEESLKAIQDGLKEGKSAEEIEDEAEARADAAESDEDQDDEDEEDEEEDDEEDDEEEDEDENEDDDDEEEDDDEDNEDEEEEDKDDDEEDDDEDDDDDK